jgi:histidinol-phosphate aminotransferase
MTNFLDLAAPGVRELTPYIPGKPVSELQRELGLADVVKLASNENPLGPSPKALAAARAALDEMELYPDGGGFALKAALSAKLGVAADQITLGNGSNDVLDLIARVFLTLGDTAVFSEHAFAVYPISTQAVGARGVVTPAKDYGHDLDAMAAAIGNDTKVVFIANPNNPTGTYIKSDALYAFLRRAQNVVVVVDEAYCEYVDEPDYPDSLKWLAEFPNLIVTRTFSKAYGLAGLRVGYAVSSAEIADLLNRVRQPFNVNSLGLVAAAAALEDGKHLHRSADLNRAGLKQLGAAFETRRLAFIPSVGNFLTVDLGRPAAPVYEALLRRGVIVRPVANYGLPNHLRVTVGTTEQNSIFLRALDAVRADA